MDHDQFVLLEALRLGAAQAEEMRLYRSGKLLGLFPARTSANAALASQAVRDGLLEIARTETKGKTTVEWVRVTRAGIDYLVKHESPAAALDELRSLLRLNQEGTPSWLAELRQRLDAVTTQFLDEVAAVSRRLEQVAQRATSAIERLDEPDAGASLPAWGIEAVRYVEERSQSLPGGSCSLAELFAALRTRGIELRIKDFHAGLRRLHEHERLKLLTHEGDSAPTEPEFALLDGGNVYYEVGPKQI